MSSEAIIETMCDRVKQNLTAFCAQEDLSELTPETAALMAQGISEALAAAGQAGYEEFIESHEAPQDIIVKDGQKLRFKQVVPKIFLTPFGEVRIERRLYQADLGGPSHVPLDQAWGMQGQYATPEVREAVLYTAAHLTPVEVEEVLTKCALFQPSSTAIKHMITAMGRDLQDHEEELAVAVRAQETAPDGAQVLAASLDGTNVNLREHGPKRGRPAERPGQDATPEPCSTYKNAMVASVSFYAPPQADQHDPKPQRLESRYLGRMPEERFPTLKRQFEAELDAAEAQAGPGLVKVLVLDGAKGLWAYAGQDRFQDYEKILDFFHATEHLSKGAEALFGKASPQARDWYAKYRAILLERPDGAQAIIRSMDYYLDTRKLPASQRREVKAQRTFFARNKHHMSYAEFRTRGLPIGSGVVEAACKTLVKQRMGRSGMRWSRQGGQPVLTLRAYVRSGRWDTFWKEYCTLKAAA